MGEPVQEEPGRARVVPVGGVRAGPVQRLPGVEPFVADARVVGPAAAGGPAQLVEDGAGRDGEAVGGLSHPHREAVQDLQVGADTGGRGEGGPAAQDASFEAGRRAVLLGPLGHGQDHVREFGGLGRHQVGHHQQVERGQAPRYVGGVGGRDDRVRAEDQQGSRSAGGAKGVQELVGAAAGAGQGRRIDPQTPATWARAAGSVIMR